MTRSVPSSVTNERESTIRSPGSRIPNRESVADEVLQRARCHRARCPHVVRHQPGERPLEPVGRSGGSNIGHAFDPVTKQPDVARRQRHQHVSDRGLLDRVEAPDRTEVDEPESVLVDDEHVAGVGVGVEEAVAQDLLEEAAHEPATQLGAVEVGAVEVLGVGQREADEPLLHQQSPAAQAGIHLRDPDRVALAEQRRHLGHRLGLAPEVELGAQPLRELVEQLAGTESLPDCRPALREVREECERSEIALHDRLDARPLHLDHDLLAGVQPRAVGLAHGRRGQRLPVELREHGLDLAADLGLDGRLDQLDGLGGHPILQLGELRTDLGREQVHPCRGDLAQLDVDAAGLLQHATKPRAGAFGRVLRRAPAEMNGPKPSCHAIRSSSRYRRNTSIRVPIARSGCGAMTRPACSPRAREPGRASRSSMTAVAIVAGMPIASMWSTRSSVPQSQPASPSARTPAMPQPMRPARSAVVQPRRMPSSRMEIAVVATASSVATAIRTRISGSDAAASTDAIIWAC